MPDDALGLIDALAAELDRPVGLDDRRFRALAYSSHVAEVDRVRRDSILQRAAPPEVTAWLEGLGIRDAEGTVRVAANAELGMAARVCVPVRFDGTLLGYLWLIDEPTPLTAPELEAAERCADDLGIALYRARRLEHGERERERDLLKQLVGRAPGDPAAAAAALLDGGLLPRTAGYAVLVAQAFPADDARAAAAPNADAGRRSLAVPDAVRVRLAAAAEQVRRALAPHHLLVLVSGEQVVAVLACATPGESQRRAEALAAAAARTLADSDGWSPLVGVGEERAAPEQLAAAHDEARLALRVGRRVGGFGTVVQWPRLGAYRTLATLFADGAVPPPSPAFQRLLCSSEAQSLVPTLECYLDLGGDARAAAEALFVHRSSLYGRLHRIEEIAGVDLHSGDDRLELHLALRLWRLSGAAPPRA